MTKIEIHADHMPPAELAFIDKVSRDGYDITVSCDGLNPPTADVLTASLGHVTRKMRRWDTRNPKVIAAGVIVAAGIFAAGVAAAPDNVRNAVIRIVPHVNQNAEAATVAETMVPEDDDRSYTPAPWIPPYVTPEPKTKKTATVKPKPKPKPTTSRPTAPAPEQPTTDVDPEPTPNNPPTTPPSDDGTGNSAGDNNGGGNGNGRDDAADTAVETNSMALSSVVSVAVTGWL